MIGFFEILIALVISHKMEIGGVHVIYNPARFASSKGVEFNRMQQQHILLQL